MSGDRILLATAEEAGKPSAGTLIASKVVAGAIGASYSLVLPSNFVQVTGTLTANATIAVSGLTEGCTAVLLLGQDGTGGRTLHISDGATSLAVTVPSTAGAEFAVTLWSPDGETVYVETGAEGTVIPTGNSLRLAAWGVKAEPYPVAAAKEATITATKKLYGALVGLAAGTVLKGIVVAAKSNAVTLTGLYACLYDRSGNLLTAAPFSQPEALNAAAGKLAEIPFYKEGTTTYEVKASGGYYACILPISASGTLPELLRQANGGQVSGVNGGSPLFVSQTGQATPPEKGTLVQEAVTFWIGVY